MCVCQRRFHLPPSFPALSNPDDDALDETSAHTVDPSELSWAPHAYTVKPNKLEFHTKVTDIYWK